MIEGFVVVVRSNRNRISRGTKRDHNLRPSDEFLKARAVDRKPSVYVPASDRTLNMLLIKDGIKL